jgi:cold shock CspA family protein
MMNGTVSAWDEHGGYGTVTSDSGESYFFHCTQIVDGTRTIEAGVRVSFEVVPGRLGRWEAVLVEKHPSEKAS